MDIRNYVYNTILPLSRGSACQLSQSLVQGLDAYMEDNGFFSLIGIVDDVVISKVIDNSLAFFLSMPAQNAILYFSNYSLIGRLHLVSNKALMCAEHRVQQKEPSQAELSAVETELNQILQEICKQPGLYEYLRPSISDTLLDLDYAKGIHSHRSRRLSSKEVIR